MNDGLVSLLRKMGNPYMNQAAEIIENQNIMLDQYRQISKRSDEIIEGLRQELKCADVREKNKTFQIAELTAKVESLRSELQNCRDELCLKCGSYFERHKGACDGCRYKEMNNFV